MDSAHLKAAGMLKCDLNRIRESKRISNAVEVDRDLLICIARQSGVATHQNVGDKFGPTCSAV